MSLVDGEGKPIPRDSWGGDLDPQQSMRCAECGVAIPFGKFCPQHLAAAQTKNEEMFAKSLEAQGIDPEQAKAEALAARQQQKEPVDMTVAMAQAQERAAAIVTPGQSIPPPDTDHLQKSGPAGAEPPQAPPQVQPASPAPRPRANLVLPAADQERVSITRRSDEFLIGQAVGWVAELRTMAEEGKVPKHLAPELLQLTAELTYALAGLVKP